MCACFSDHETAQTLREKYLGFISLEGAKTQAEEPARSLGLREKKKNPINSQWNTKKRKKKITLKCQETFGPLSALPYALAQLWGLPFLPGLLSCSHPSSSEHERGQEYWLYLKVEKPPEKEIDESPKFIHIDSVGVKANGCSSRRLARGPPFVEEHSGTHWKPS